MRVVILTPDTRVDRRILQQAESLFAQGYEIILLAQAQEGLPQHERLGNVKVERLSFEDLSSIAFREKTILYLLRKVLGLLGLVVRGVNKLFILAREFSFGEREPPPQQNFLKRMLQYALDGSQRLILKILGWLGKLINKIFWLILQLSNYLRGLRLHEQILLNRVIYYDPDVIQVHDLPFLKVGLFAKQQLGIPLVYDARELYPEIGSLSPRDKKWLVALERKALPLCDQVITVNAFIAEEMAQRYQVQTPAVIHNAIKIPAGFTPGLREDRFRQIFPIPAEHNILLYQGWMSLERGLQNLVEAMTQVPETIHLVLMGYGDEALQALQQTAQAQGICHRLHFKETVSHQELLFWTASADAGIIPYPPVDLNNYYCSPGKLFEFIQAGLPIIANDLPFLRQIVVTENFGVVMPLTSIDNFAQAIRSMFDREAGGPARFKKNLLAKAAKYDWTVEETKFLNLYAQLKLNLT